MIKGIPPTTAPTGVFGFEASVLTLKGKLDDDAGFLRENLVITYIRGDNYMTQ